MSLSNLQVVMWAEENRPPGPGLMFWSFGMIYKSDPKGHDRVLIKKSIVLPS